MTPFRQPPELSDDLYPGLAVWEKRVTGSLTLKDSRLPLWAIISTAVKQGWDEVERGWGPGDNGYTADDLAAFLYDLLEHRGEFARLLCVLADVHRVEAEREHAEDKAHNEAVSHPGGYCMCPNRPWVEPWWNQPDLRRRVADQLQRCLATVQHRSTTEGDNP